jgi:AraC-like DNA-binding protein
MQTADKIFHFDTRDAESPLVQLLWRTWSEPYESFTSVAGTQWEMVVTRQEDRTTLTVRGPETKASTTPIPTGAQFFGVRFRLGSFMPSLPVEYLADTALDLPQATSRSFWLNGSAWDFPTYENADVFVRRLVRKGLLVRDPVVEDTLRAESSGLSQRSIQRRIIRATGLTRATIKQIERANEAVALLNRGSTILDTVQRLGYADQPHLTRSLKRFIGYTPAHIVRDRD